LWIARKNEDSKWIARGRMTIPKWQFKVESERKNDNSEGEIPSGYDNSKRIARGKTTPKWISRGRMTIPSG
jgi:hypothetical protein